MLSFSVRLEHRCCTRVGVCGWLLRCCSWTFSSCLHCQNKTASSVSGCRIVPAGHQSHPVKELQQTKSNKTKRWRETDRKQEQRSTEAPWRINDDDGERLAWWRGWSSCLGTINFSYLFYSIDMLPEEVNAIIASAVDVCLVDDWLFWHLIFQRTVTDEVTESWEHPNPTPPTPAPSIIYLNRLLLYISHCFKHKCLLKPWWCVVL